jgi:hypothetical protein
MRRSILYVSALIIFVLCTIALARMMTPEQPEPAAMAVVPAPTAVASAEPARELLSVTQPDGTRIPVLSFGQAQAAPISAAVATYVADASSAVSRTIDAPALLPLEAYAAALRVPYVEDLQRHREATRYTLYWDIEPAARLISGTQTIRYVNRSATALQDIVLRTFPSSAYFGGTMRILEARVDGVITTPSPAGTGGDLDAAIRLALPRVLEPGAAVQIVLSYVVQAPDPPQSGYRIFGLEDAILSLPSAYAQVPPREADGAWLLDALPGFGDVVAGETALFSARIRVPANVEVAATGVCETQADGESHKILICVAAPVRDFALHMSASFRVSEASAPSSFGEPIQVRAYYLAHDQAAARRMLAYAVDALQVFEAQFGPYPYRVLNVFQSTTSIGGIEYPMAVGVTPQRGDEAYFEWLTAHEVAHQWWYGLVGNVPTRDAWLDEGLAQYATLMYFEQIHGPASGRDRRQRFFVDRWQREVRERGDIPAAQRTEAFPRMGYAPIVYGKAPLMFDEVRRAVGDARFLGWLRRYLEANRYQIADAEALLRAADETGIGAEVRAAHARWILSR